VDRTNNFLIFNTVEYKVKLKFKELRNMSRKCIWSGTAAAYNFELFIASRCVVSFTLRLLYPQFILDKILSGHQRISGCCREKKKFGSCREYIHDILATLDHG
jgi:hypothetical protein